jgi:hypothetical protein
MNAFEIKFLKEPLSREQVVVKEAQPEDVKSVIPANSNITLGSLGQKKLGYGHVGSTKYIPPTVLLDESE